MHRKRNNMYRGEERILVQTTATQRERKSKGVQEEGSMKRRAKEQEGARGSVHESS